MFLYGVCVNAGWDFRLFSEDHRICDREHDKRDIVVEVGLFHSLKVTPLLGDSDETTS